MLAYWLKTNVSLTLAGCFSTFLNSVPNTAVSHTCMPPMTLDTGIGEEEMPRPSVADRAMKGSGQAARRRASRQPTSRLSLSDHKCRRRLRTTCQGVNLAVTRGASSGTAAMTSGKR